MRRRLVAVAVLLAVLLGLPATAGAGRPRGAWATITDVRPGAAPVLEATDDCGTYRMYDATVTLSWAVPIRLFVYLHLADGTNRPPGEVYLAKTGTNRQVVVHGVIVPEGTSGRFLAVAVRPSGRTYQTVTFLDDQIVSFPAS